MWLHLFAFLLVTGLLSHSWDLWLSYGSPWTVACLPAFWPHPGNLQMSFKALLGVGSCFPLYRLPLTPAWWHQLSLRWTDYPDAHGLAGLLSANTGWEAWWMRNGEKSMPPNFLEGKWLIAKNMIKVNEVRFVHCKTQVTVLLIPWQWKYGKVFNQIEN